MSVLKHIGIVGSRRRNSYNDYLQLKNKLEEIYEIGDIIVSGGCSIGADSYAELLAKNIGATIIIYHADWNKHGKQAGFIRNTKIAEDSDILIALPADDRTGGTEDTIRKYKKTGKNKLILLDAKYSKDSK